MGLIVRLERLDAVEAEQLANLTTTTAEGERLRSRAGVHLYARQHHADRPQGRWPPLARFAQLERIMSREELAAALRRHTR